MSAQPTRPVLRYHGGKWLLAPWIIAHFPPHVTYVEPFGGAASVLLRKPRVAEEVYNDLDGEIANLFRVLRDPVKAAELVRAVYLTPWARDEFEASYEPTDDPVEGGRRTIVRAAMGFGTSAFVRGSTGWRRASKLHGSGSYAHDWAGYPLALVAVAERMRGVVVDNRPADDVMAAFDRPGALHYLDPPYPHSTRGPDVRASKGNGYRHEMSDDDHRALAATARAMRGMVVISGYACELYDAELYPDWARVQRTARAQGNTGATTRTEVLWLNPAAAAALQPTLFDGEDGRARA